MFLLSVESGDDEPPECGVEFAGGRLTVMLAVGGVTVLPFGFLVRIFEDDRGLFNRQPKGGAGLCLLFRCGAPERMVERISVCSSVSGTINDSIVAFELALKGVNRDISFYMCHVVCYFFSYVSLVRSILVLGLRMA